MACIALYAYKIAPRLRTYDNTIKHIDNNDILSFDPLILKEKIINGGYLLDFYSFTLAIDSENLLKIRANVNKNGICRIHMNFKSYSITISEPEVISPKSDELNETPFVQIDERDTMFSRKELKPGSEKYNKYYAQNNDKKILVCRILYIAGTRRFCAISECRSYNIYL